MDDSKSVATEISTNDTPNIITWFDIKLKTLFGFDKNAAGLWSPIILLTPASIKMAADIQRYHFTTVAQRPLWLIAIGCYIDRNLLLTLRDQSAGIGKGFRLRSFEPCLRHLAGSRAFWRGSALDSESSAPTACPVSTTRGFSGPWIA